MARKPIYSVKTSRDHRLLVVEPINEAAERRLRMLLKRLEEEEDADETPLPQDEDAP